MNARYGINLSFRDDYDREEVSEEKTVNFQGKMMKAVQAAVERFDGVSTLLKVEQQAAFAAPYVNDELLRQNGYKRGDILPAYLEAQLYDEGEYLTDAQINAELLSVKEELFDAIYHVKDILPLRFTTGLGDDYITYAARRAHNELGDIMVKQGKLNEEAIDRDLMRGLNPDVLVTPTPVKENVEQTNREFGDEG